MASPKTKREARQVKYSDATKWANDHESAGDRTTLKVPDGVQFFSLPKPGTYRIDILPYIVGKGNPYSEPGMAHYERTFWVHRGVGVNQDSYCCPRKTFNKKCPICTYQAALRRDPNHDKDVVKELEPKERQLWWVKDLSEPQKGYQLWDISYHLFGKLLKTVLAGADDDDTYDQFARLDTGLTLKLTVEEKSYQGHSFREVKAIEFKARKSQYDDSVFDELACLDDIPKEFDHDTLKKIFMQQDSEDEDQPTKKKAPQVDDEDDAPPPKKKAKPAAVEDDEDDTPPPKKKPEHLKNMQTAEEKNIVVGSIVQHSTLGKCNVIHVSPDGTSLRLEDEEGTVHRAQAPEDCELETETPKKKKAKPAAVEDDEEDAPPPKKKAAPPPVDDDEDDDDPPPPKKKAKPPVDDEDDDDPPPPKKKPAPPVDDDDDEDDVPPPKKKAAPVDDDEDDEPAPPKKKAKPPVDDDDDFESFEEDDEPAPPKKKTK
jgi:hypothetical protein